MFVSGIQQSDSAVHIYVSILFRILFPFAAAAAKLLQSGPTLCDPIDGSPPRSPIPGILQARTLEWVAISFSNAWTWKVKGKSLSHVRLLATPWTAAYQAPPSMGFSRQEYWSGVPLPSPLFPFRLLQNIEQSSLSCAVGPCWLSILKSAVCTCQSQTLNLSLFSSPVPW